MKESSKSHSITESSGLYLGQGRLIIRQQDFKETDVIASDVGVFLVVFVVVILLRTVKRRDPAAYYVGAKARSEKAGFDFSTLVPGERTTRFSFFLQASVVFAMLSSILVQPIVRNVSKEYHFIVYLAGAMAFCAFGRIVAPNLYEYSKDQPGRD